jgi:hypothetical protein
VTKFQEGDQLSYIGADATKRGRRYKVVSASSIVYGLEVGLGSRSKWSFWGTDMVERDFVCTSTKAYVDSQLSDKEEEAAESLPEISIDSSKPNRTITLPSTGHGSPANKVRGFNIITDPLLPSNAWYFIPEKSMESALPSTCQHDMETVMLFTSNYSRCRKCGHET